MDIPIIMQSSHVCGNHPANSQCFGTGHTKMLFVCLEDDLNVDTVKRGMIFKLTKTVFMYLHLLLYSIIISFVIIQKFLDVTHEGQYQQIFIYFSVVYKIMLLI